MIGEIEYHAGGELVEIRAPRMTLIFTKREWVAGLRRGKAILRSRRAQEREAQALDRKISASFPRFG
jgi:hypothetical protein